MKLGTCIDSNVYNMLAQHLGLYLEGQGHSIVIWSQISKLFHINDRYIETMCHV